MNVFVLNCGSSSLKYQLINMKNEKVIAQGLVEKIGEEISFLKHTSNCDEIVIEENIKDHNQAIELVLEVLQSREHGVIENMDEINVVGHRVVHAGEKFSGSVLITKAVIDALRENIKLAPLHNPANIIGIEVSKKLMPKTPDVGVFDTAFHQSMPAESFLYALPYEWYQENGVRRYGFHGTSHKYVSERGAEILNKEYYDLKIITCHLGNGASVAAIDHGKVIDTSMGLTPLEGLVMGTRPGDLDPGIIPYIMKERNMTIEEVDQAFNKASGVLGISGLSNDFRELTEAAEKGNKRAELAIDIFCRRVKKYIGAYIALMDGVDLLIFTAGIGENAVDVRAKILSNLENLGIIINQDKNKSRGKEIKISSDSSAVDVYIIPTNEELVIAREAKKIIENNIKNLIIDILNENN
ncbi:Acetate kinase [Halanaerobium saccharolyticum subsp. saccharolyticum DSM 6643]|uniref:Acetate kinase n=1 Tax=Halanaerobium saccharolyticum subsp. saccharolyticum DSM 6643 TaxID=1293054 RepID=M5DY77_9FIRM|nr:acetate kinase [Halanaerobium saccharolyticum]CCU77917.1 Acetate kinase [Halanaerobium saccharolyticum subsp. saccharolyticum DSM 6643]